MLACRNGQSLWYINQVIFCTCQEEICKIQYSYIVQECQALSLENTSYRGDKYVHNKVTVPAYFAQVFHLQA